MISMSGIDDCLHGIEILQIKLATYSTQPSFAVLWGGKKKKTPAEEIGHLPMLPSGPISVLAITFTDRSFWTLPIISTAWLSWRWAS